jgi:flagellar biosynthetic protein FlhB
VSSDKASRTEPATPKKTKDARKKGEVAKSMEVSAWTTTFAMTLLLPWTFSRCRDHMFGVVSRMPDLISDPDPSRALALWNDAVIGGLVAITPMAVALMLLGVAANLAQVGIVLSPEALKPKFKKLNPLPGLKRMVGAKSLWGACKELIKLTILGALAYRAMSGFVPAVLDVGRLGLPAVMGAAADAALSFLRDAALLGLVLAAADLTYERKHFAKDQRMSFQDIKDENKQTDGDPQMKGMIRERQMRMSRNRMMADIATADVVLVNPTHVAVALRYEAGGGAPRVVAKGSGAIAAKIRERAQEHRVPLVRDVPLARALHKACDIGDEIPADLYAAVAQVLAFLFALKSRGVAAGTHVVPGSVQRALAG